MGEAGAGTGAPGGPEASPEAEVVKLLPFLAPGARADLQAAAVRHVLALTGSGPGRALLAGQETRAWSGWCGRCARPATTPARPCTTWRRCSPTSANGLRRGPSYWTPTGEAQGARAGGEGTEVNGDGPE
uniref:HGH1 homolog n=1 Tax=Macaca nemestrina TaxID=9545 RepID=A0A2K6DVR7_MACNE